MPGSQDAPCPQVEDALVSLLGPRPPRQALRGDVGRERAGASGGWGPGAQVSAPGFVLINQGSGSGGNITAHPDSSHHFIPHIFRGVHAVGHYSKCWGAAWSLQESKEGLADNTQVNM